MPAPQNPFAFAGSTTSGVCSDRRIIEVLAAPQNMHDRLLQAARRVPQHLLAKGCPGLVESCQLYGSLSLDMAPDDERPASAHNCQQDWSSYYVNARSDVDFVVKMKPGVSPQKVKQRLLNKGPWRLVGQVQVHKFASTQYTFLGSADDDEEGDNNEGDTDEHAAASGEEEHATGDAGAKAVADGSQADEGSSTASAEASSSSSTREVYLDVSCIEDSVQFDRFEHRQKAFRRVFLEVRSRMELQYDTQGALAFDAYIHLLKAFAAKVPGNALTGFQATCLGLFTLQIGHFQMKLTQSIALSLFEGFLRFCFSFYADVARSPYHYKGYAIDLTLGGRWLHRLSTCWRSEIYFMDTENAMGTGKDDRMNVAHSLEPSRVSVEAQALLTRAFASPTSGDGAPGQGWPQVPGLPTAGLIYPGAMPFSGFMPVPLPPGAYPARMN
jgi:hypothetical protein